MRRMNVTYSVTEEEFDTEVSNLLASSEKYLTEVSRDLNEAGKHLEDENYERSLKTIASIRDRLAYMDFRLHDSMSLIAGRIQLAKDDSNIDENETTQNLEDLNGRMEEIKKNIQSLGLSVSDEEIRKLLEEANG